MPVRPSVFVEKHDGPILRIEVRGGVQSSCSCSCGWRTRRFGTCRVPLVRAWHAHVLRSQENGEPEGRDGGLDD